MSDNDKDKKGAVSIFWNFATAPFYSEYVKFIRRGQLLFGPSFTINVSKHSLIK